MGVFAAALSKAGIGMLLSLLTEGFLKGVIIVALEKLVKKTDTDIDDNLLDSVKEAWGIHEKTSTIDSPK